jgi:molecular chaperone GrpE
MRETESEISQLKNGDQAVSARSGIHQAEAELSAETARLKEENERLRSELRRINEIYICNLADFDDYRRRLERVRERAAQAGKRELILSLLELMDDFERALNQIPGDIRPMVAGLDGIQRRLVALLEEQGVTAFDTQGKQFNPLLHEAVDYIDGQGAEPGTVVAEISRGWQCGGDLLRSARVRVAQ